MSLTLLPAQKTYLADHAEAVVRGFDALYSKRLATFPLPTISFAQSGFLLRMIANMLPEAQPLLKSYTDLLRSKPSDRQALFRLNQIAGLLIQQGHSQLVESFLDQVTADRMDALKRQVHSTSSERNLVMVCHKPYFAISRQARALRSRGWTVHLVCVEDIPDNLAPECDDAFETVWTAGGSWLLMAKALKQLDKEQLTVLVQCWMFNYCLARLVRESLPQARLFCEFYDVTSLYAGVDHLLGVWPEDDVYLDLAMEAYIFQQAEGVITRFGPAAIKNLQTRYGPTPVLQFWPYPMKTAAARPVQKEFPESPPRLLFAGGVFPKKHCSNGRMYPGYWLPEAIDTLLGNGLHFTILHDPHRPLDLDDPLYEEFRDLKQRYPDFRVENGFPPSETPTAIGHFDFGTILFEFPEDGMDTGEYLLPEGVGTKLFTYLEAGLPVIVSREYNFMARIVEENGLGIAVGRSEIPKLPEHIASLDYAQLRRNVANWREANTMEEKISEWEAFVGTGSSRGQ